MTHRPSIFELFKTPSAHLIRQSGQTLFSKSASQPRPAGIALSCPLLISRKYQYRETMKHRQRASCCHSELAEFALTHQSLQTWGSTSPSFSATGSWPARPAPEIPAICGTTFVPTVPSHGILQKPKHEPGSLRVAPVFVINKSFFIEELVVPDSTRATATGSHLDFLETWPGYLLVSLSFGALFVIQLLYRYPVSHGGLVGLCYVTVQLTGNLQIQLSAWRYQSDA